MSTRPAVARRSGALLLVAAAVLSAVGLAGCGSASGAPRPPAKLGTVLDRAVPASILNIPLTRPDGTVTSLAAYHGKPVMIADYLTLCSDICPLITANTVTMARMLQADGVGDKVALLEITVDPARDTPARMTAYGKLYGDVPANWTQLRASPANTTALWKFFGVYTQKAPEGKPADTDWLTGKPLTYDIAHSDDLLFLNGSGHERYVVNSSPYTSKGALPATLAQFLSDQGQQLLAHPNPAQDWTPAQGVQVFSWLTRQHLSTALASSG